ncbi:MAG TPA: aminotransferase class I/II-fold pyridoxal phosphate-dependent enzyme, partial [Bacteroidia bacterium]|nr:aminotransferase class I/II-fold pyridoxal phosphate-dependent enzyme [Bacteroidia bacterium]
MYGTFKNHLQEELKTIEENGLFKRERIITSEQGAVVKVNEKEVIVFCANNYLGLSSHPKVIEAAHNTLNKHGYGMSSVRFICGTQDIHKELEKKLSDFVAFGGDGTYDAGPVANVSSLDRNGYGEGSVPADSGTITVTSAGDISHI